MVAGYAFRALDIGDSTGHFEDTVISKELKTLGDHLRKERLDLKLIQREVAERLGVDETTVYNWENNRSSPYLRHVPKIIEFLDYLPYDTTTMILGEKILTPRRSLGRSQKDLAPQVNILKRTTVGWNQD